VAQWLALLPHSTRDLGSIPAGSLSVWSLHILPVSAWVSSGLIGHAKFSLSVPEQAPECGD